MENFEKKANTVGTQEAGKMLGLQAATVAQKCRNNEFPNAKQYKKITKKNTTSTENRNFCPSPQRRRALFNLPIYISPALIFP